jgi:DNA-binding NarL/FixJ family response regulator
MLPPSSSPACLRILILKADTLCASVLEYATRRVFPAATFRRENTMKQAVKFLASEPVDLLLTGIGLTDGDTLDLLSEAPEQRKFTRALVVTGRSEHRILTVLKGLSIHGIFDPTSEGLDRFEAAVRLIGEGGYYWSGKVLERLREHTTPAGSVERLLSPTEQLVFAVVGDGSDDSEAAERLNLRPSTIHSVRRELHRKLGVRHKGELVRMAVQHGYVRFTAEGVQRPGFSGLLAACQKARGKSNSPFRLTD